MTGKKAEIMDAAAMRRILKRLTHQLIENTGGGTDLVFVGIERRGVSIARKIAAYLERFEGVRAPVGTLDITFYRDDLTRRSPQPVVRDAKLTFSVNDKKIVLVDDVLYTGRTARAAMDAIMDIGRPAWIKLVVLVDRGHRELPIRADFVGKNVPTARSESISVKVEEFDGEEGVTIFGAAEET